MAATPSIRLDEPQRRTLLETAVTAIERRLAGAALEPPDLAAASSALRCSAASFVTLKTASGLRGCCGTLEPRRALLLDVWHNAQASAFADRRFTPLEAREWATVTELEVSVLSAFEPIEARSEAELQRSLVPGIDGLVLQWRGRRATFLPKVWEQLRDRREFVQRLKMKAGWEADFWAADIEILRYRTENVSIERPAASQRRRRVG